MLRALKFLYHLQKAPKNVVGKTSLLTIAAQNFIIKHYKKQNQVHKSTLILFSGFSVEGYKDKRIRTLAKSLASIGFDVYLISLDQIEQLKISIDTIKDIQTCIRYLATQSRFNSNGKVAIFAPSFSAGMSLIAASDKETNQFISAICTVGTFASLNSSIKHILEDEGADDYGRNILMKNILEYTPLADQNSLRHLLQTAIEDNGFKREEPLLPLELMNCGSEVVQIWEKINKDPSYRLWLVEEAFKTAPNLIKWQLELDVLECINNCTVPIYLLHGANDLVIPSNESLEIYKKRNKQKLPTKLHLSPLIDHGDAEISLKNWKEILSLNQFFSQFFNTAFTKTSNNTIQY